MEAYYQRGGVTLYHGDCREVLPGLGRGWAHLLLTDPPYGQAWESAYRHESFGALAGDEDVEVGLAGLRVAIPCVQSFRHFYVFGRFDFAGMLVSPTSELVWAKDNMSGGDLREPWGNQHEYIQFGVVLSDKAQVRLGRGGLAARLRKGSVLRCARPFALRHPTEKPVGLVRELIESSTRLGDIVLDPFAGAGTTLEAAVLEGRGAVGVELDERYCEVTAQRLDDLFEQPMGQLVGAGKRKAKVAK